MPSSKRKIAAFCSRYPGITDLLGLLPAKPVLLVLNYHRIGHAADTPFDPGVFSATANELDDQVAFLKRQFHLTTLDEALEIIEGRALRHTVVLLTFDDGYRDNYELAFPILSAHRAQGVFFLPTSFIGTNTAPVWDSAAYIVKHSRVRRFRLPYAPLREFDLDADGPARVIQQVLALHKTGVQDNPGEFLAMLEEACDAPRPDESHRIFLNWEEAAAMLRGGMAFGSHTHTHPVLSTMNAEEIAGELALSRRALEARLGVQASALAYPFGLQESISPTVFRAAEEAQFRAAFSFYEESGCNLPGSIERFNVRRRSVSPEEAGIFRLRTAWTALTAGR